MEFCILNANRTTEVLDATWDEFDLEEGIWSIPARRMKGRERHNIPLSKQSIALIKQQQQLKMSDLFSLIDRMVRVCHKQECPRF